MGFAPVVYLGLKDVGGWGKMTHALSGVAQNPAVLNLKDAGTTYASNAWTSAWQPLMGGASGNPMGVDIFAMVFGLGFVLSFGYWCTNFLVVQRAMAAKNMTSARRTPLIAAVPKMFLPLLVILPGMIAASLAFTAKDGYRLPTVLIKSEASAIAAVKAVQTVTIDQPAAVMAVKKAIGLKMDEVKVAALLTAQAVQPLPETEIRARLQDAVAENDYDGVILSLVKKYCPMGLLGLALTALLASFMSGMAGNVTAFNTVWTYDLYQAYIAKNKSDAHYMTMGRCITVVGILLSIACAYFARNYSNAMDVIQLVFGFVNAPLFATFLLGMFWKRTTSHGAFFGLMGGTLTSALFHACTLTIGNAPGIKGGYLTALQYFPSEMAQNFWLAAFAFLACFALTVSISLATKRTKSDAELTGLVYSLTPKLKDGDQPWYVRPAVLGTVLLLVCVVLNIIFF